MTGVSDSSRSRSPDPLVRTRPAIAADSVALLLADSSGPRGPDYGLNSSDFNFWRERHD